MSAPGTSMQIEPSTDARWVGRRLGALLAPGVESVAQAIAWCDEQVRQGHMCLDFTLPVVGRTSGEDADAPEGQARLPMGWLADVRGLASAATRDRGSLEASDRPLVVEGERLFFAAQHADEIAIARALVALARRPSRWAACALDAGSPTDPQAQAAALVHQHSLSLVIGGPGTGKTTVARSMVERVLRHDPSARVLLLAPTGKATARLAESIRAAMSSADAPAMTIHRALIHANTSVLASADLIIVDESSMVAARQMRQLLDRLPTSASLVLLGDAHQLASIESGCVLADIVPDSASHPLTSCTVRLERNYRFKDGIALATLGEAGRTGNWSAMQRAMQLEGAKWIEANTPSEVIAGTLKALASLGADAGVLCAHRRGMDGSLTLSREIARKNGAGSDADPIVGRDFDGRRIIITVNDPATGLVNGETGRVEMRDGRLVALFRDRPDPIDVARLPRHEAAYAITIHKSQGSEYDKVIVVLPARPSAVLSRELLYTAITRAKSSVVIVSSEASLRAALATTLARASGLRERIVAAGK
jgi:exodeoxyribonuclease V alpha subunit